MPRFSTSLTEEQHDWLEAQADRRDRSKADVVRQCIDAVRTGSVDTDAHHTDAHHTKPNHTGPDHSEAVDDLRDRVAELEDRIDTLEKESRARGESAAVPSPPEPPESGLEDRLLAFVREYGPVSKSDVEEAFDSEWQEKDIKARSWWLRHARPILKDSGASHQRNRGWLFDE